MTSGASFATTSGTASTDKRANQPAMRQSRLPRDARGLHSMRHLVWEYQNARRGQSWCFKHPHSMEGSPFSGQGVRAAGGSRLQFERAGFAMAGSPLTGLLRRTPRCGALAAGAGADFDGGNHRLGSVAAGEAHGNDAVLRADIIEDQVGGAVHAVPEFLLG